MAEALAPRAAGGHRRARPALRRGAGDPGVARAGTLRYLSTSVNVEWKPTKPMPTSRREFLSGAIASAAFLPLVRGASSLTWAIAPRPEFPLLSDQQLGHLRHIERLASLPDGEWAMMGSSDPGQEDLTAYRYQLATMAYAVGLTHYHHLPAAPGLFRRTFDRLIQKMLRREVWSYWRETSRSGPRLDPGLKALRDGWTDPVKRENIMYSGHLHAMVGMYATLFNDDKYDLRLSWPFPDPADPSHYLPLEKWIMSGRPRALFAPPSRERVQELLDALDDKTRPCYAAKFLRGHITCANCNRPRIIYGLCALLLFPPH